MNRLLIKFSQTIDQLPLIAKAAILAVILIGSYLIWQYAFWQDLHQSIATINNKIKNLESTLPTLATQVATLEKDITTKKAKIKKADNSAFSPSTSLLSPYQSSKVLHNLLVTNNKLTLIRLKNIPPKETTLPDSNSKIFEHGITIQFSGDYFSTLEYLQAIEKLKWKIFWDKIEYKVTQYPLAEITLDLHTVSTNGDWIHV